MTRFVHWVIAGLFVCTALPLLGQLYSPNHPELKWYTIETEHFQVHFYDATERSARVAAKVAEEVYDPVTNLYQVKFDSKIHLILKDTDDYSNGAAYYYDNKIVIWALPLDFELRGSHNWLRDVITHELTHIIQLNAAMKFTRKIPAVYFQWIRPEKEHRDDVIYGYPNTLMSYPYAGTVIPPWFAEGTAQYNVKTAPYDYWDSHRDMILRDRVLHNNLLSWNEMNTFGKKGTGNESVYNQGFSLVSFIARNYGQDALYRITDEMRSPLAVSFDNAIQRAIGKSGKNVYEDWVDSLHHFYKTSTKTIRETETDIQVQSGESTGNFFPRWSPNDSLVAYMSNKGNDYLSQTGLFLFNRESKKVRMVSPFATSGAGWAPDGKHFVYTHPSQSTKYGSVYDDLYVYDLVKKEEKRLTESERAKNPDWSPADSLIVFVSSFDGTQNLYLYDFTGDSTRQLTDFSNGEQIFAPRFSDNGQTIVFDMNTRFGRDIYQYSLEDGSLSLMLDYRWDVRSPVLHGDTLTFADDRSGIFNIYQRDLSTGEEWPITNVPGGAFMPDIAEDGTVALALYQDGGYRFGLYHEVALVDSASLAYKNFQQQIPQPDYDDSQFLTMDEKPYSPEYSQMFIIPRLLIEYGTIKPGVYFYSNEILEQMSVMGGASINRLRDLDIFLQFEYNQFRPTLYADIAFLTRNIEDRISVYDLRDEEKVTNADLRFSLMQANVGLRQQWYRFPLGTFKWDLFGRYEQYSTFIKYVLSKSEYPSLDRDYLQKLRYEYFIGKQLHFDIDWDILDFRASRLSYINKGTHLNTTINYSYELNDFIDDFRISESGLLKEKYTPNNYHKIESNLSAGMALPFWEKSTIDADVQTGWISKDDVDDFFYFFGGGMPGLKGYPFYSIDGSRVWTNTFQWLVPVTTNINWRLIQLNFKDIYLGPYFQVGDAWTGGLDNIEWKRSAGMELRLGGFSFYSYPTAITLDAAYGLDSFKYRQADTQGYGHEWRYYFKLLFEFDT